MTSHPLEMSLSVTGWAIDPEFVSDLRLELVHSQQCGNCFRIKLAFLNGSEALLEIEIKEGAETEVYDALTEAIRTRRIPVTQIEGEDAAP